MPNASHSMLLYPHLLFRSMFRLEHLMLPLFLQANLRLHLLMVGWRLQNLHTNISIETAGPGRPITVHTYGMLWIVESLIPAATIFMSSPPKPAGPTGQRFLSHRIWLWRNHLTVIRTLRSVTIFSVEEVWTASTERGVGRQHSVLKRNWMAQIWAWRRMLLLPPKMRACKDGEFPLWILNWLRPLA